MPKNNENVPDLDVGPTEIEPLRSFTPDEMVRCESCLRANPPTRVACLYCGHSLPILPTSIPLQKPVLRPLEKWERGYNNILLGSPANAAISLKELAEFLRLAEAEVQRIIASKQPLPLARSVSQNEAQIIQGRLESLGMPGLLVSDEELGLDPSFKLRAMDFHTDYFDAYQSRETAPLRIKWSDAVLLLEGRITRSRVEVREEPKRNENRMLEADQFFGDENVIEFYLKDNPTPYRIISGSFDFSCLGENKRLLAAENMAMLADVFRKRAPGITDDQTYNSLRKALDPVWKVDQQTDSTSWRRARPGKYALGSITETSNEQQFSRYSRLRFYLLTHDLMADAND